MARASKDEAQGPALKTSRALPASIVRVRWLLVIAVSYLIIFGTQNRFQFWPHQVFIAVMLLSNILVMWIGSRPPRWPQMLDLLTVLDVLAVAIVIGFVDPSLEMYVACFAGLILGLALSRTDVVATLMVLVCGSYAILLYNGVGSGLLRNQSLLLRLPFLFAVALYFSTVARHSRKEKKRTIALESEARHQAHRADKMEREQFRLRALSQIGRLGLTSAQSEPAEVLLEMVTRVRDALSLDLCSLLLFEGGGKVEEDLARSNDDTSEVRALLEEDADLVRGLFQEAKLIELREEEARDSWLRIKNLLPDPEPMSGLLVAPILRDRERAGVLLMLTANANRSFNEAERDFAWTAALMVGAFLHERTRLENEARLRTMMNNAPVMMFALDKEAQITVLQGKLVKALKLDGEALLGRSLLEVCGESARTYTDLRKALGGKAFTSSLEIRNFVFEVQYSPLTDLDGAISGVIGVTTALLEQKSAGAPTPGHAPSPADPPSDSSR